MLFFTFLVIMVFRHTLLLLFCLFGLFFFLVLVELWLVIHPVEFPLKIPYFNSSQHLIFVSSQLCQQVI